MKPEIKIEPDEYKGWALSYSEQHNNEKNWCARKKNQYVFAVTPAELVRVIDEREQLTVRFSKPLKALFRDSYATKFAPVEVHTLVNGAIYMRDTATGTEATQFLSEMHPDKQRENHERGKLLIHDSKENHALLKKGAKLMAQAGALKRTASELVRKVRYVTDADVLVLAEESKKT